MQYKNPKKMQCNTPVQERQVDVTAHFKKYSLNLVILLWALCAVFFVGAQVITWYTFMLILRYFQYTQVPKTQTTAPTLACTNPLSNRMQELLYS
jgi:hypothetical protein